MGNKFLVGHVPQNRGLRHEAKLRGDFHYFTGVPCKNGHIEKRIVSNGSCMECSRLRTANGRKAETDEQRAIRLQKSADRAAEWRKKNPDHENTKIVKKMWDRANPERKYMDTAKRRASKLKRTPVWLDVTQKAEIEFTYLYCSALRSIGMDVHVDHIVPLQGKTVSGMHVPWNLQVIHAKDNLRKANNLRTS